MFSFYKDLFIETHHKLVILLCVIFHSNNCIAQDFVRGANGSPDIYILPAYAYLKDVSWRNAVYSLETFEQGTITFKTGFTPKEAMPMNYNFYLGQISMINYDGDTVELQRSKEIKLVKVGDHLFFHDQQIGYMEIILELPIALGVHRFMTLRTQYAQGMKDGTSYGSDVRGTPAAHDRYYRIDEDYYVISGDNKAYKATPASILKLFHSKKEINAYLTDNAPDFNNKEDLLDLLWYCNDADAASKN